MRLDVEECKFVHQNYCPFFPVSDIFCDRSAFFLWKEINFGERKITTMYLKVAPFLGQRKKERNIFLIVLILVNLLTTKPPHQLFNIFPSSSFPFFHLFFFLASFVIQFGALRECLIPRERKLETLERVHGTLLFSIETNDFVMFLWKRRLIALFFLHFLKNFSYPTSTQL